MEPVMEAFTSSRRPTRMAKKLIINSAALPSVPFRNPLRRGPARWASSSVAQPINIAIGTIPRAEARKVSSAGPPR